MVWRDLNTRILEIWREHFPRGAEEDGVLAPLFYPDHSKSEMLFVGINPSFSERETAKRAPGINVSTFYQWKEFREEHIPQMAEIQGRFIKNLDYFKRMQIIAQEVKLGWAHLDIYPLRETNQKKAVNYLKEKARLRDRLEELFKTTIDSLKPDIIVVANADASKCVKRIFEGRVPFDEKVGFHRLEMAGKSAAVFFSGMLSGQRALDTGSFDRLRWHVRKAAEELNSARIANAGDRRGHMGWGAGDIEILD